MINPTILRDALLCPICRAGLRVSAEGRSLLCAGARTHCFDISSSGYVGLAPPNQSGGGDPKELVQARSAFLGAGYYAEFAEQICRAAKKYSSGNLAVDAGCGEGYYTLRLADAAKLDICGFDLSKYAADAAARAAKAAARALATAGGDGEEKNNPSKYSIDEAARAAKAAARALAAAGGDGEEKNKPSMPRTLFCVGGIFDMPLKNGCADTLFNLFAPCAEREFARVLRHGGCLILASAGEDHLLGLKSAIYDTPRKNTSRADLPTDMRPLDRLRVSYDITLDKPGDILALFTMTPYFYRTGREERERLTRLEMLKTRVDFDIFVYGNEP